MSQGLQPEKQGLYDPRYEHDACGIGMLANIRGEKSHTMVTDAIEVLNRLKHRGGAGSEKDTGDGAGLLLQLPHAFFAATGRTEGRTLPQEGDYGVAMLFASPEEERCGATLQRFEQIAAGEGLQVLWIRRVPTNINTIGRTAAEVCPSIYQIFVARPEHATVAEFERALYALSKLATQAIRAAEKDADPYFYVLSCSSKTVVYKGMLLPRQLAAFYLDLLDERVESAIVLVHSRFSTNTFPSWERAHPQRILIHNGEINTIRGNVNWTKSRQARFASPLFGEELSRLFPVIDEDGSDSAMLDDFIRFLVAAGYSLPHALAMAVPEPYENNRHMPEDRRAFYEYHNCLSEPWDGPAALAFSDGDLCGALLDRNGLRPSRYTVSKQGVLVLASEIGVYDIPAEEVATQGRIQPGEMLLVDTRAGRIIEDGELKAELAEERPYAEWLQHGLRSLDELGSDALTEAGDEAGTGVDPQANTEADSEADAEANAETRSEANAPSSLTPTQRERLFGYSWEDLTLTLRGMVESKDDPIGSMGTDIPLAVLSERPQLLYSYFKQLFAQVTNPPIDSLREKNVVSSSILLGSEGNLLEPSEASCRFIKHPTPVLLPEELQQLKLLDTADFRPITLPIVCKAVPGSLEPALDQLFEAADRAVASGHNILILSDEGAGSIDAPIPALLACSGLHHHLVRAGTRTACSIVVAAGDAWETHHLAMLIGYGANAVCPHQAFATLDGMVQQGQLSQSAEAARSNYVAAATKGIVKTMSKMGISTVRSYHGAQVFEALGIGEAVIERYFTGTISRIGGLGIEHIEAEVLTRHREALTCVAEAEALPAGGNYKWRAEGEYHLFSPESIFYLQQACKTGDFELFKAYTAAINQRSTQLKNIRSLFDIRLAEKPVSLETVESEDSIVRRFKTGAMSYGSISAEAHTSLALAMNRLGAKSNTGEGGEDPARFVPDSNGESRCSAIKQVASARFGVTIEYLSNAREIQIKMAQGAKPGEGGHLPGAKVYPWIAACRHATPGVELISPPPHHDIYSIEDLAQLIHDLKNANPAARISVKLVSEAGVGTVAVGVAKGLADVIVVSGYDGGTGAAARTSIRHAGLPWELGVAETHQSLLLNGLRNRVTLETDGKLLTGRDIVIAALLGAEEFAFATSPLIAMGCDMMRVCNLDSCPVGIATQNPELRSKFCGGPEHVENLMRFLAREVREWMSRMGLRSFNDLVGRTELLRQWNQTDSPKARTVDLSDLMYQPKASDSAGQRYFQHPQQHHLSRYLDEAVLIPLCKGALEHGQAVEYELPISNQDRTVGCRLSGTIALRYGSAGLPADTIKLRFTGYAGQSFGAFVGPGISLHLTGGANDYLGKGLCGGSITVAQPEPLLQSSVENTTIGNVSFFGATSGEGYISGRAGERFCVRNSGATVVVEGVGDHGCEYMTGGVALILGETGQNFAAGMSGGIAYLYDPSGAAKDRCNLDKAALYPLDEADRMTVLDLLDRHIAATASPVARRIRGGSEAELDSFIKLVPDEYKKVLDALEDESIRALEPDEQMLAAFHAVTATA